MGSHYIYIRFPDQTTNELATAMDMEDIQHAVQELENTWKEAQSMQSIIQASNITNTNPWLRMTRWSEYLEGIAPKDLTDSVAPPEEEPMDPVEQGVRHIWAAMEQVVRKSQRVVQHSGQAICIKAIQSEKGQTPYRPLQVYMDPESVVKHIQPWQ
ncbi:uncharacterized protein ATNIH1004_003820 [Aspergillus tanneri]|uniref:Uncharacterized protein n=1 Tax=Aspergillus tanneri TaxID=1220188 RepID=A0A5M9MLP6_9EURO|nr:uncharacterized protein ATNIH1004_003820 [Aspergillus tanneri]KAA8647938.1 hypothetical protein ATNIH1004_003820 [Aspergillus tanneri]